MSKPWNIFLGVCLGICLATRGGAEPRPAGAPKTAANLRALLSRVDVSYDGTTRDPALQEELSAALRQARSSGDRAAEAAIRARLGRFFLTEPATGEAHLRLALEISRAAGDRGVEAAALFALGESKLKRRLPRRALEPLATAAEVFHHLADPRGESAALDLLSRAQEQLGLYEEALTHLGRAREVRPNGRLPVREATESMRLGRLCYALGRYQEAAQHLEAPLEDLRALRERMGPQAYGHFLDALRPLVEKARNGSGEEFPREEKADLTEGSGEGFFQVAESYGVPRPSLADLPELRREEEAWLNRALAPGSMTAKEISNQMASRNAALFLDGRLPHPMEGWFAEQAARLNQWLGKTPGRPADPSVTPESIEQASLAAMKEGMAHVSLDKAYGLQFQLAARLQGTEARKTRLGLRPASGTEDPDLVRLQPVVWAEMVQEEMERPAAPPLLPSLAEWMEDSARRMFPWFQEEAGKSIGPEDAKAVEALACEAELHNFLGRLLALDGSVAAAEEQYRQAWDIVEATDLRALQLWLPRPASKYSSPTGTGYDLVSEHGAARALKLPPAPTLSKPCGNESDGSLDLWWGDFLAAADRDDEALQRYHRAAERGVDQTRPLALGGIAAIYEREGKRREALDVYRQAIDAVESILGQIRLDQLVSSFAGRQAPLYTRAIDLATELALPDLAFELAERARARAFLNQIGNHRIDFHGVSPDLIAQWQRAREKLEDARARRRAGSQDASDIQTEELARQAYEELLQRLKRASPEYASLVAVEVAGREEVQQLLPLETTLVDYFVLDRRTLAWVIDKNESHLVELPITEDELRNLVETFRLKAANRVVDDAGARELHAALLDPLKPFLLHPNLVLVPFGPLHYLPFAALRDASGRFLIEKYTIALLPSPSALRFAGRGKTASGALVLGNLDGSLPQADREAEAVAALYGRHAYRGAAATEALVQKQAGRAGILHLAAHGFYDQAHPLFSRVELAPGEGQDGALEVHEIYQLDLSATRLVVLSSCETALGERSDGDDVVGLSRALLATGAGSVITTLWKIDDQSTGALMTALHRRLRQGGSVAAALRAAQLEILAKPEWRSPYDWAAFTLTGLEGVLPAKPKPRSPADGPSKPSPPPPASASSTRPEVEPAAADPESDLVAAMFRAKDRAHKSCRPVTPDMARILSRFFPPDLVSTVCQAIDTHGEILQGLSFHEDLPVVPLDDALVFRTEKNSLDPALWSHALQHVFEFQRLGIAGFVRVYLLSRDSAEKQARDMERFVAGRLANRLEADPTRRCAAYKLQFWYGLDFESYCISKGHTGVDLVEPNAHGWKCVSSDGVRRPIDVSDACRWQYCGTRPLASIEGSGSAYSWFCVEGEGGGTSTLCRFDRGPRAGQTQDYAPMAPLPVGSSCQDGVSSTGRVVASPGSPR